jgi:NitT/TauT family transport system permease protein
MTAYRALLGLILSAIVAIPIGLALGYSRRLYHHVSLPVDVIRSIPAATLFPVFILAFGIGEASKIAVVIYGCFFVILMSSIYGGRGHADRVKRINTLISLRATKLNILRFVVVPDAMTSIVSGLRIAASIALVLVVVTEMFLGANDGLGKRIYDAYLAYRIPDLYGSLVLLGFLGYIANTSLEALDRNYRQRFGGIML